MRAAPRFLPAAALVALHFAPLPPQFAEPEKFGLPRRLIAAKAGVRLVCGGGGFARAFAHVLRGERGGDDEHFCQTAFAARSQQHAANFRVQRQAGEFAPERGERVLAAVFYRAEFDQQLIAVVNAARAGCVDEGEMLDRAEIERAHAQDDARQRGAQDFRLGVWRAGGKVGFVVETDAHAIHDAPAAPGALVGGGLRDFFHRQLFDLVAQRIALDARQAAIDHVADARHGQRGFCHVGCQHDAPRRAGREHARLFGGGLAGVERQNFRLHSGAVRRFAQGFGSFADFALAGQKDEHVARSLHLQFVDGVDERIAPVALVRALGLKRAVADFDGIEPPGNLKHRRGTACGVGKMGGEAFRIQRCRGDDDFEVGTAAAQRVQIAKQKVDVGAALVRFVDDQRVVGG